MTSFDEALRGKIRLRKLIGSNRRQLVIVYAGGERHIICETMVSLEHGPSPEDFVRLNRSLIVNVGRIVELKANGLGNYYAVLQGGKKVNVTVGLRELEQKLRFAS